MKPLQLLYLLPLLVIGYGAYRGAASPEERSTVLRLGHGLNEDHPVHKAMVFMAREVEKNSGGKLRIVIYPNEQLGPERDAIEQLQFGSLNMTKVSTAPLESFTPAMSLFSLPNLFNDREHMWRVLNGPLGEELLNAPADHGVKGLCYYDAGARSFYISKRCGREIRSVDDLKGLNIRVQKSRSAARMVELFGAKPIPVPLGELYSMLDTGGVDGAENNPPTLHASRHFEVCASYCLNEHSRVPDILLVSLDTWNRLTPQQQQWLSDAAHKSSVYQRRLWDEAEAGALAEMQKSGLKVIRDVDIASFRRASRKMYDDPDFRVPVLAKLIERIQQTP